MGRPKKIKPEVEATPAVSTAPVVPTQKTKAQEEHEKLVEAFAAEEPSKEVSKDNNSLKNLNDVLASTTVDDIYKDAKNDPTMIVSKSSVPEFENNVDEPKAAPLTEVPKDLTVLTSKFSKGDEDAPFSIAADSQETQTFTIHDTESDRLVADIFYANRSTNVVALFLRDNKGQQVAADVDGKKYPVLIVKNHSTYFKRKIKI